MHAGRRWQIPALLVPALAAAIAARPAFAQIDSALAAQLATEAKVIDLTAADNRTCARLRDGSWKCWGEALLGAGHSECGAHAACDPTPVAAYAQDFRYIVPKSSGCGVRQNGTVECWGAWGDGSPTPKTITAPHAARVLGLSNEQICVGSSDNQVACRRRESQAWKSLPYGDVVSLGVSDTRVGLVRHQHILTMWNGDNGRDYTLATRYVTFGRETTYAVSRQWGAYIVADGTTRAIPGLERVVHFASDPSAQHVCASIGAALAGVKSTGGNAVRCRGPNNAGQLGTGDTRARSTFEDIEGISNAMRVAVGSQHSCALTIAGEVYCWGANNVGQLGVHLAPEQPTLKRPKGRGTFTNLATGVSVKAHDCGKNLPCALTPVRVPVAD
jgi:hypothetical protein